MDGRKFQINWLHNNLIKKEGSFGSGIFTEAPIKNGELLVIFGGHIMTLEQEMLTEIAEGDYPLQIHDNFVIGPAYKEEIEDTDFINHSCDPNSGFKGQIFLVAMRNINVGEEICFDYAMALSGDDSPSEFFQCKCGKSNCRKAVTLQDWKIPDLQVRYKNFFQQYIQEKIEKL